MSLKIFTISKKTGNLFSLFQSILSFHFTILSFTNFLIFSWVKEVYDFKDVNRKQILMFHIHFLERNFSDSYYRMHLFLSVSLLTLIAMVSETFDVWNIDHFYFISGNKLKNQKLKLQVFYLSLCLEWSLNLLGNKRKINVSCNDQRFVYFWFASALQRYFSPFNRAHVTIIHNNFNIYNFDGYLNYLDYSVLFYLEV